MKITFMNSESGDWTVLYIDGRRRIENHSLSPEEVLEAMGIQFESMEVPDEVMERGAPEKLTY